MGHRDAGNSYVLCVVSRSLRAHEVSENALVRPLSSGYLLAKIPPKNTHQSVPKRSRLTRNSGRNRWKTIVPRSFFAFFAKHGTFRDETLFRRDVCLLDLARCFRQAYRGVSLGLFNLRGTGTNWAPANLFCGTCALRCERFARTDSNGSNWFRRTTCTACESIEKFLYFGISISLWQEIDYTSIFVNL